MWKSIPDFKKYEASDEGYIRNSCTGRVLKNSTHSDGTGIPCVSLISSKTNKLYVLETRFVIACTFMGVDMWDRPKPKFEYIDGDKFNNSVSNIRIKTVEDLEGEIWKPIFGFESHYHVSNRGRVKRLAHVDRYVRNDTGEEVERPVNDLILKLQDKDEYQEVCLTINGTNKYISVHRLVAQTFIPNPEDKPEVNHIDGDKHNNNVENLEWVTCKENVAHSIINGLRSDQKGVDRTCKQIRCIETGELFANCKVAAQKLNIPYNYLISRIDSDKNCHGFHFERVIIDRRIKCLDTGQVFNSPADAQRYFGFNVTDSIRFKTCTHGLSFCYIRDDIEDEVAYLNECRNRYSKWNRADTTQWR